MMHYKIYIVDGQNHISLAHDFEGPDDRAALEKANTFSQADAVEIWQRTRLVARIVNGGGIQDRNPNIQNALSI